MKSVIEITVNKANEKKTSSEEPNENETVSTNRLPTEKEFISDVA